MSEEKEEPPNPEEPISEPVIETPATNPPPKPVRKPWIMTDKRKEALGKANAARKAKIANDQVLAEKRRRTILELDQIYEQKLKEFTEVKPDTPTPPTNPPTPPKMSDPLRIEDRVPGPQSSKEEEEEESEEEEEPPVAKKSKKTKKEGKPPPKKVRKVVYVEPSSSEESTEEDESDSDESEESESEEEVIEYRRRKKRKEKPVYAQRQRKPRHIVQPRQIPVARARPEPYRGRLLGTRI